MTNRELIGLACYFPTDIKTIGGVEFKAGEPLVISAYTRGRRSPFRLHAEDGRTVLVKRSQFKLGVRRLRAQGGDTEVVNG